MIRKNCCKILINFIIYSIIGFFMETVYAIFTKGLIESRKSFLYGPFCIVYGLAAIILILSLNKIKGQKVKKARIYRLELRRVLHLHDRITRQFNKIQLSALILSQSIFAVINNLIMDSAQFDFCSIIIGSIFYKGN